MDYFELVGQNYGVVVDRLSNCFQVYQGKGAAETLVGFLNKASEDFGVSKTERISV